MSDVPELLILEPEDHVVLGEAEFGMPGLLAIESIGPFHHVKACGPLITVHDSIIEAGLGIGHHPHRYNERLFYLERGTFDHDDALNGISGHIPEGALARFTEGQRGMIHEEWNHGEVDAEIFILVGSTDPVPTTTSFEVLEREDMPLYEEAEGVSTREMIGSKAPLPVYTDVRAFTDSTFDAGAQLTWTIEQGEGGLLSVRAGSIDLDGETMGRKWTAIMPPIDRQRSVTLSAAEQARLIRATFGRGYGFVTAQ